MQAGFFFRALKELNRQTGRRRHPRPGSLRLCPPGSAQGRPRWARLVPDRTSRIAGEPAAARANRPARGAGALRNRQRITDTALIPFQEARGEAKRNATGPSYTPVLWPCKRGAGMALGVNALGLQLTSVSADACAMGPSGTQPSERNQGQDWVPQSGPVPPMTCVPGDGTQLTVQESRVYSRSLSFPGPFDSRTLAT
jgi:hypothetical protein